MARETVETCTDCGSRLSRYRNARDKQCAPCQQARVNASLIEAYAPQANPSRSQECFALRWRGYSWETIAKMIEYPNPSSAQSAARDYAKRKTLTLP